MADKKYYWLKLKKDFFKRHDIKIIENMENGTSYVLFYLKLLCESVDHEGNLRFSDTIPYNEKMLATITDTNIDIVRNAMILFRQLNLVEILDDQTIYLNETARILGVETASAERVRRHRALQDTKALQCNTDVTKCNTEIDIDKDKDIYNISSNEDKPPSVTTNYKAIVDLYNSVCASLPRVKMISEKRKKTISARLKTYTIDVFREVFEKAENSDFLKGKNSRSWQATFDWLISDANMAKVLDGNYDNHSKKIKYRSFEIEEAFQKAIKRSYK